MDTHQNNDIAAFEKKHFPGWKHLLEGFQNYLPKIGGSITDVKEKWGGLRIGTTGGEAVMQVEVFVEALSARTCAKCGTFGRDYEQCGYYLTLCESCAARDGYEAVPKATDASNTGPVVTQSRNGFAEIKANHGGWTVLAATLSVHVGKNSGTITKFEVNNGRLRSNWNCNGDAKAKASVKALCLFANELSSRMCHKCAKSGCTTHLELVI